MNPHIVYLSIGSNIGDKKKNLEDALGRLRSHDKIEVTDVSRFYKTEPQNFKDQDWFVNAAVKIKAALPPEALLLALKTLEKELDQDGKSFRFGPRIIDLDIVYYDDLILKTEHLEIPHPRLHERCFVLIPICDIGAHIIHPVLKLRSDELLKKIEKQETQKVILLEEED
ncbi:MAG: 2-amino-4-hydroxy-6-hydroxymethyldihydropteridine diphosphokinase [Proteobacteria bacterium]|nr:2-amino-4-hydroxy-6-hydroxymethyldihydropteridine diphosphokinase [Pseudomonadota bacterium]MBU1582598.1 2-amino-4-hydroxy-6-hydroxymethyldihydropteridine diphosphokinase [Pseudomonadota bacterium]MBU2452314.1 2-amino-4-hydroxy-6-hydroxymethyldihydropteridine diphosphokinase [Pseudomonadota bacterium]MBU2630197.1 2-amino-4-hydroxy-6-hydroxymethyldihydropteridine diphosphokinase [Pseudomonadota bacterium]